MVFQNEYLSLVEQCMNFACELMDLCRGTQEVEAVLSESNSENGSYNPLERLKMAMEYEEKKVNNDAGKIRIIPLILVSLFQL